MALSASASQLATIGRRLTERDRERSGQIAYGLAIVGFDVAGDPKELFALHDEMRQASGGQGDPLRRP